MSYLFGFFMMEEGDAEGWEFPLKKYTLNYKMYLDF